MGLFRKGENWFIDYRVQGRRIREKIGASRKLAESVLSKRRLQVAEKKYLDIRHASRETFGDFAPKYMEWASGRLRRPDHEAGYIRTLSLKFENVRLCDFDLAKVEKIMSMRLKEAKQHPFRGKSAGSLSAEELRRRIQAWTADDPPTVSKSQVNREVSCLRRILNKAADWKLLPAKPLAGLKLYDEREFIRKRYLKPEEIRNVLAVCSSPAREVVIFALYTGRRFGEIMGMRWPEVDLENGYVYYPRTKKKEPDQVGLPPRARQVLAALYSDRTGEHVFRRRDGTRLKDVRSAFRLALRKNGISDFHFHDLRHTAVSYMIMNGLDLKTIAEMVGHTTAEMVDKRYGHLSPDHKRVAVELYGSAMDRLSGFAPSSTKRAGNGPEVDTFWTLEEKRGVEPNPASVESAGKIRENTALRPRSSAVEQPPCKR